MSAKIDGAAALARCEASGKLDGVRMEYYVGGGLPPPLGRSDQFMITTREGRAWLIYSRPSFDPQYDKVKLSSYPNETYRLPAEPSDVKRFARLIRETGVFDNHFPEETEPGVADSLRTEVNITVGDGNDGRVYYRNAPSALEPLRTAVEAQIERLKATGEHGVYDANGKKPPVTAPSFERLEYVATYGGIPAASAGLVIANNNAATLRFDGNRDSPLFPRLPSATRSGQVSAERRRALDAALATAAITGPAPLLSTVGPTATGRVTLTRGGAPVVVEFPLYDPTPRWLTLRDALDAVVAELLDGVTR